MHDAGRTRFNQLLFYSLVLLTGYLSFLVLQPFLASLAWAVIFAMMFHPVHLQLAGRVGANRAALLTTVMAGVLIVGPAVLIVSVFAREVPMVLEYLRGVSVTPDQVQADLGQCQEPQPVRVAGRPDVDAARGSAARAGVPCATGRRRRRGRVGDPGRPDHHVVCVVLSAA